MMQRAKFEFENKDRCLKELLKAQDRGILSGVHGRIGDFGAIDKKYDKAISTAIGQLDYILVDTIDNCQACINYLRDNRVGKANFIALTKCQEVNNQRKAEFKPVPGALRLFDLVQCENQYKDVFFWAMKNILVVDSLDNTMDLAYKQGFRLVALNGNTIE
jgi:structural maintenance of chromosome 4